MLKEITKPAVDKILGQANNPLKCVRIIYFNKFFTCWFVFFLVYPYFFGDKTMHIPCLCICISRWRWDVCGGVRRGHRPSASCARGSIPRLKTRSCVLAAEPGTTGTPLSFSLYSSLLSSFICSFISIPSFLAALPTPHWFMLSANHSRLMFFRPECSL